MRPICVVVVALMSFASTQALGVDIRVNPSGSDTAGCGAPGDRCATLAFALTQVSGPDDLITLDAGTWALNATTELDVAGADGAPLVIRGAGPTTVLDGSSIPGGPFSNVLKVSADFVTIEDMELIGSERAALALEGAELTVRGLTVRRSTGNNQPCVLVDAASATTIEGLVVHGCDGPGMRISGSQGVTVATSSVFDNGSHGVSVAGSNQIELRGLELRDNNQGADGTGILLQESDAVTIGADDGSAPTVITGHTATGIEVLDCVVVGVEHTVLSANNGAIAITEGLTGSTRTDLELTVNHVTIANSTGVPAFTDAAAGTVLSVTNSVIAFNSAGGLGLADAIHQYNLRFDNGAGGLALDATEVGLDPLFADATGGDYHLRSAGGRFTPGGFVNDGETSPAVDLGDPGAAFNLEGAPNGGIANAGAFGNTPQASRTPGTLPDASQPDTALPDSARPDAAAQDTLQPDGGQPDAAADDAARPDVSAVDALTPDAGQADSAATDSATTDGALPDTAGQELAQIDATAITGVIARAGADRVLEPPAEFTLDGSGSTAPASATFVWTLADSPLGPGAEPMGHEATVTLDLDAVGIFVFQLTVTANGVSDSDLVVVTMERGDEAAVEGCGCVAGGPVALDLSLAAMLLLVISGLRRRAARYSRR